MKFKKNDLVSIDFSAFCSVFNAHNDEAETEPVEYHKVLNCRMTNTGIEYKLRGCYGWWKEDHLKLKPEGSKNSSSRSVSSGPTNYIQNETKCDTEDSRAFWDFSVPGYARCSSCDRSFEALPTVTAFKDNNRFCRMCGKTMEVKE